MLLALLLFMIESVILPSTELLSADAISSTAHCRVFRSRVRPGTALGTLAFFSTVRFPHGFLLVLNFKPIVLHGALPVLALSGPLATVLRSI